MKTRSNRINKNIQNTNLSNQSIIATDFDLDSIEAKRRIIKNNIEYDILVLQHNKERLDEMVEIMLELLCRQQDIISISNNSYPLSFVHQRILSIDSLTIQYVFDCLERKSGKINNIKAYLLTTLFNAPITQENFYTAEVKHDMGY